MNIFVLHTKICHNFRKYTNIFISDIYLHVFTCPQSVLTDFFKSQPPALIKVVCNVPDTLHVLCPVVTGVTLQWNCLSARLISSEVWCTL